MVGYATAAKDGVPVPIETMSPTSEPTFALQLLRPRLCLAVRSDGKLGVQWEVAYHIPINHCCNWCHRQSRSECGGRINGHSVDEIRYYIFLYAWLEEPLFHATQLCGLLSVLKGVRQSCVLYQMLFHS